MILEHRLEPDYANLGTCVLQIREFLSTPQSVIDNLSEKAKKIFDEYEFSFIQRVQNTMEEIHPNSIASTFLCKKALPLVTGYLGFVTKYKTEDIRLTKNALVPNVVNNS